MDAGGDWLELATPDAADPVSYLSVSPVMLRAMEQAAGDGRVAETVLLAHHVVGTLDLAAIHPADAARVARALDKVGQPATATAFAGDVAKAHLLAVMRGSGEVMPIETAAMAEEDAGAGTLQTDGAAAPAAAEAGDAEAGDSAAAADTNAETSN